ncbi:MAG: trypsin-like peptidase domain-containing protein [Gemmatimonadales bacterium]|nr:trypsin-like peptidase domain-containing protein [Gemmatimonadales bacterium]
MPPDVSFEAPFFDEISKYAVRFAVPVIFGDSTLEAYSAGLNNGTASLLKLGDLYLAITCQHVIEGYRQRKSSSPSTIFQLGTLALDPEAHILSEDVALDLAVLNISPFVGTSDDLATARFHSPPRWPPRAVSTKDILCFAGFPGVWREDLTVGHIRLYTLSSGASPVLSATHDQIVSSVAVEDCVTKIHHGKIIGSLGGMSGGPVFVWREGPVLTAELVGFIYEYQDALDLLLIRSANRLAEAGIIV